MFARSDLECDSITVRAPSAFLFIWQDLEVVWSAIVDQW